MLGVIVPVHGMPQKKLLSKRSNCFRNSDNFYDTTVVENPDLHSVSPMDEDVSSQVMSPRTKRKLMIPICVESIACHEIASPWSYLRDEERDSSSSFIVKKIFNLRQNISWNVDNDIISGTEGYLRCTGVIDKGLTGLYPDATTEDYFDKKKSPLCAINSSAVCNLNELGIVQRGRDSLIMQLICNQYLMMYMDLQERIIHWRDILVLEILMFVILAVPSKVLNDVQRGTKLLIVHLNYRPSLMFQADQMWQALWMSVLVGYGRRSKRAKVFEDSDNKVYDEVKALYTLAIPMILSGLLNYSKAAISMFFMGKLGKSALAGGSLAISIANITGYSLISGLATGMDGISSQAFGARNGHLLSHTLKRTVVLLLTLCMPITLLWFYFDSILIRSGQNSSVSSTAITYLRFSIPTLLFQSIIHPIKNYLRSQKVTRPFMLSTAFSLAFHVPANYTAIYHYDLGLKGIALAGCLADLNVMVMLVIYLFISGHLSLNSLRFWRDSASFWRYEDWEPIFSQAIPSCATVCLEWWWYEIMIVFSGLLVNAPEALATMGILIQMTALIYQFPISLGLAVSTRVGNELGANRPNEALTASLVALGCSIFTGMAAMSFMFGMQNVWGAMFTSDPAIIQLVANVLPVVGLCELGNSPQTTVCGVFRGCARPTLAAHINFISFYCVGLPVALVLGFGVKLGILGLWLGLLAAQMVCFGVMLVALIRTNWEEQANRALLLTSE